ncbi:MAG: hypothetical protein ABIR38_10770 [Chthoniobacterales bacterium]
MNSILEPTNCRSSENVPSEYCRKLRLGIARLELAIQAQYENPYPAGRELIARAVREEREAAWGTPFPSLFFPALAHLKVSEVFPSA